MRGLGEVGVGLGKSAVGAMALIGDLSNQVRQHHAIGQQCAESAQPQKRKD